MPLGPLDAEPESPWALQLAARIEKIEPPRTAAVCEAAALATIALLDDERSQPDGEWHVAVSTWNGERIRKLVRRARGAAWERAQAPAGVTVDHDGAEVRAFVPSRMSDAPTELAKLQIQSTPLDEIEPLDALPELAHGALAIAVTPAVEMSWGKQAAQCAHAAQWAWMAADQTARRSWERMGRPIAVIHPTAELWSVLHASATTHIHDGGFTEIPAGTNTAVAWWHRDEGSATQR